ncbi:hypothetical protein LINGRAHAP2_LOCUS33826 [Linum grandiflorum]
MKHSSTKFALLFLLLIFIAGAINAQPMHPPYPPTGETCGNKGDCKGGVYCVCDKGKCYCSAEQVMMDPLLSKDKDQDHQR